MGDSFDTCLGAGGEALGLVDPAARVLGRVGPRTNDLMAIWSAIRTSLRAAFLASVGFFARNASVMGALDGLGRGSCSTEVISPVEGLRGAMGSSSIFWTCLCSDQ